MPAVLQSHVSPTPLGMNTITRSHRIAIGATVIGLLLLTLCHLLPIDPQGPFDARDFSTLRGMRLEQSGFATLSEPWAAPFHIVAGAPDFRLAGLSGLIWVICGTALWRVVSDLRARRLRSIRTRVLRAVITGFAVGFVMALWVGTTVTLRLPRWRLVVDDPNALIVDLHSHTYGSHDALVSGPQNLAWHAAAGYNVVAVTEHRYPAGAFATKEVAQRAPETLPAVIPGQELGFLYQGEYLPMLLLGLQSDYVESPNMGVDSPSAYMAYIHNTEHGAAIALGFMLEPEQAGVLADAGIDGFEIANYGHPNIPTAVRNAMSEAARNHGLALVATSDWHGCGGTSRTWTVIHTSAAVAALSQQQKADLVLQKLRERGSKDIIPVVAGYLGPPSWPRAIFSPFAEAFRYAAELTLAQVASWWAWSAIMLGLAQALSRVGLPARWVFPALLLAVLGISLWWTGLELVAVKPHGLLASGFPRHIGTYVLMCGTSALLGCGWLGHCAWRKRTHFKEGRTSNRP